MEGYSIISGGRLWETFALQDDVCFLQVQRKIMQFVYFVERTWGMTMGSVRLQEPTDGSDATYELLKC